MWRILFWFRQQGYHFRRQVQIGPYFIDFACHHAGLAIEVDGATHADEAQQRSDNTRDAYLRTRGYSVLRFWNTDVMENPEGVHWRLAEALELAATPTLNPSPQGGGKRWSRRRLSATSPDVEQSGLPPPCGEGTGEGVSRPLAP